MCTITAYYPACTQCSFSAVSMSWRRCYSTFLFTVDQQPWVDAQSRVGSSVMRRRCWLSATEWLIVPVVTQQRVNTRLAVMIITSILELERLKWLHDHVWLCCRWTDCWARSFRTIHVDFSKIAPLNLHRNPDLYLFVQLRVTFVVMQAAACFKWHFGDGFYEIKRPSTRLSTPPELNWIFSALI